MFERRRIWWAGAMIAVVLVMVAAPVGAQNASPVIRGATVDVSNGTECTPNTDVVLFFEAGTAEARQIANTVSDAAGHFEVSVQIPGDAATGDASIVVDCGLDQAVLTYRLTVGESSGFDLGSIAPGAGVAAVVATLIGLIVVVRRRSSDVSEDLPEADPDESLASPPVVEAVRDPVPVAVPLPVAVAVSAVSPGDDEMAASTNQDDDADYWFWETTTSAGPVRRVACMSESTFHLHEIRSDLFQQMLDQLVVEGPDATLSGAFVRIPVAAIAWVRHGGTVVHIDYTAATGRATRTVDLGPEFAAVLEMLGRRVPIRAIAAPPQPAPVH